MKKRTTFRAMALMAMAPALLSLNVQAGTQNLEGSIPADLNGEKITIDGVIDQPSEKIEQQPQEEIAEEEKIASEDVAEEKVEEKAEKSAEEKIEVAEEEKIEEEKAEEVIISEEVAEEKIEEEKIEEEKSEEEKAEEVIASEESPEEKIEVAKEEKEENAEEEVASEEVDVDEEVELIASLREEKEGLETSLCRQEDKISDLQNEIKKIKESATGYMPIMNSMNQLMMMNMMMANQGTGLNYQPSSIDLMSQMLAPTMLLQSMNMGMQMRSMTDLYHNYRQPAPQGPQYNYNVGGDFYGRDYSMTQAPQPLPQPQYQLPQTQMAQTPFGYDFSERNPNFGNIEEAPQSSSNTTTDEATREPSQESEAPTSLSADSEMI